MLDRPSPVPPFSVYLFDVDGTLVDSAADICGAIRLVLADTAQANVDEVFLRGYIGRHLNDLFWDLFPDYSPEQVEQLVNAYRHLYPARDHKHTHVYPGVKETLARLGGRKATVTTKGTPTTRVVLDRFGLLPFFDHVQGTDGFPAKPHPDVILAALRGLGADARDCLLIGDAATDMEAAKRAGIQSCAVTYGYGTPADLARWEPDYWIRDFRELAPWCSSARG